MTRTDLVRTLINEYFKGEYQALSGALDYLIFEKHVPIERITALSERILKIPRPITRETIDRLIGH